MAKKNKEKDYSFDDNALYIVPLQKKLYAPGETDSILCSIDVEKGIVKIKSPDTIHENKYMYTNYFEWLLYTGYIKKYE